MVAALAGGEQAEAVWLNGIGGLTFRLPGRHAKWQRGSAADLADEAERLEWARSFVTVPRVLSLVREGDEQLLVTETVPGVSAVLEPWNRVPASSARALGAGLRAFHDAIPVDACPWTWSVPDRLARVSDPALRARLAEADPSAMATPAHRTRSWDPTAARARTSTSAVSGSRTCGPTSRCSR
jgi:kanamycin kinase